MLIKFSEMKSMFALVNIHIFEKSSLLIFSVPCSPPCKCTVLCRELQALCLLSLRKQTSFARRKAAELRVLLVMCPSSYLNLEQQAWLVSSTLQSITSGKYIWGAWIWNLFWHLSNVDLVYMTTSLWQIIAQQSPSKYWVKMPGRCLFVSLLISTCPLRQIQCPNFICYVQPNAWIALE